jgi:3'(2'), 5'-bisphosphate nucleotidase
MNELELAKSLAVRAGAILLEHYSAPNVRWKSSGNPVTDADSAASAFLIREIRKAFPQDGILSEEEADDEERLYKRRVWIIDPLDGTVEFANHVDEFAVMIGLAVNGKATLGVVYQPTTEKLYYAAVGSGAFLIENRTNRLLQVSSESDTAAMTIVLSRSHHSSNIDTIQRKLGITKRLSCESLGLKVGLICEGRAHLYLHTSRNTSEWDACAPDAILHEAGGRMTDVLGAPLCYNRPEVRNLNGVTASNGAIHERIVKTAQFVRSKASGVP